MSTETKPTPALLPCPFCGKEPHCSVGTRTYPAEVLCLNHAANCPTTRTSTSRDIWNTRPLDLPFSCSLSHPEIRYQGEKCPLCEARAERREIAKATRRVNLAAFDLYSDILPAVKALEAILSRPSSDPGAGEVGK